MTVCVDRDWYLSFLIWIPALGFLGFLAFTLWSGKFYARGVIYTRTESPALYWLGSGFLAFCLLCAGIFIVDSLPCLGWPHF